MLAVLYDRIGEPVFSLAARILKEHEVAEEVVAAVFTQVREEAAVSDDAINQLGARVLSLVRQRAIVRRHSDLATHDIEDKHECVAVEIPNHAHGRRPTLLTPLERASLRQSLAQLPSPERVAVELVFFEGWTQDELADKLHTTVAIVRQRINRGLTTLRDSVPIVS